MSEKRHFELHRRTEPNGLREKLRISLEKVERRAEAEEHLKADFKRRTGKECGMVVWNSNDSVLLIQKIHKRPQESAARLLAESEKIHKRPQDRAAQ